MKNEARIIYISVAILDSGFTNVTDACVCTITVNRSDISFLLFCFMLNTSRRVPASRPGKHRNEKDGK